MKKILYLEQGKKYSDAKEYYFMVPNWLFDEGEYIDLDVYERLALLYIIRLVNKKDNSKGKGDIFFLSAEQLAKKCNFSLGKAKLVLKKLQGHGYIKKIKTGNNLMKRANSYKVMNLQPTYVEGIEISLNEEEEKLSEDEFNELLVRGNGTIYYYENEDRYSHRKLLPLIVDCDSGEIRCFVDG
ncbi:hypothetical protein DVV91_04365 [Clostridium botulinum]|uniref:hypothetical protein n=1 Tax=Clostridium botulinum TaxID=1491 RepID=UPI000A16D538|nr:hypothetical protein [Clostridium botulinum]MBN1073576.1 hypothetical protein [Clostridium botulinum]